jgi:hypothetical protein
VSSQTRPDIACITSILSSYLQTPRLNHLRRAAKVVRYLKNTKEVKMVFRTIENPVLIVWGDSSFQNLGEGKTQCGFIACLGEVYEQNEKEVNLRIHNLGWKSKRLSRVARSTFTAEILTQSNSFDFVLWL